MTNTSVTRNSHAQSAALCAPENLPDGLTADSWFADGRSKEGRLAMDTCAACPLMEACLKSALEDGVPEGIFGGFTGKMREEVWSKTGGKPPFFIDSILSNVGPLLQQRRDRERLDEMPQERRSCDKCGNLMTPIRNPDYALGYRWACYSCRNKARRAPNGYIARREARLARMGHGTEAVA